MGEEEERGRLGEAPPGGEGGSSTSPIATSTSEGSSSGNDAILEDSRYEYVLKRFNWKIDIEKYFGVKSYANILMYFSSECL